MFATSYKRGCFNDNMASNPSRKTMGGWSPAGTALGLVAVLVGLAIAIPNGVSAPVAAPSDATYDGLTRDSLSEFDVPEPAPFVPAPTASVETPHQRHHARHLARRRTRTQPAQEQPPVVVVKATSHRNPVTKFVYWWNGWVINTFHTKVGTVLLGTIGAKADA